ncbi:hypothetical protein [Leuconostoc lactis]|uniref:hypothetical protein n=1 Tax=Leuconostoc lactis TaxID=1246 RepID=UPI0006DC020A|nr:hypothetical protein [Leuconostoc lactis]KQB80971.1 hypothetical protein AN225_05575 [Leuconostoc lactis]
MTYTFDKAIKDLENLEDGDLLTKYEVRAVIELLREEYAPTIEMTSGNKATISDKDEGHSLSWILTDEHGFDALYWGNISEQEIAQAWLHPETIKVVDE